MSSSAGATGHATKRDTGTGRLTIREHPLRFADARLGRASLAGMIEPGLTYSLTLAGLALSTAGNASSIAASKANIIALLAWVILRQRPSLRLGVGILIGVAGLQLISSDSLTGWSDGSDLGGDRLLLAAFFAAGYVIVSSKFVADIPPATLAAAQQIVGLVLAAGILVIAEAPRLQNQDWSAISAADLLYTGASGIVPYALAFWLYLIGLKTLQPSAAGRWIAWGLSLLAFWFVMAITPGPNKVLLASSGLRFGMRRTIPQAFGITCSWSVTVVLSRLMRSTSTGSFSTTARRIQASKVGSPVGG